MRFDYTTQGRSGSVGREGTARPQTVILAPLLAIVFRFMACYVRYRYEGHPGVSLYSYHVEYWVLLMESSH